MKIRSTELRDAKAARSRRKLQMDHSIDIARALVILRSDEQSGAVTRRVAKKRLRHAMVVKRIGRKTSEVTETIHKNTRRPQLRDGRRDLAACRLALHFRWREDVVRLDLGEHLGQRC